MTPPRSVTTWARLEPQTRNQKLTGGLEARVADPLWLLGRQWQVGEFQGEDAGSPVVTEIEGESDRLASFRARDGTAAEYDPVTTPLEALVEREQVRPTQAEIEESGRRDLREAARTGLHFHRLLARADLDHDVTAFREPLRLSRPSSDIDDESRRFVDVIGGRVLDGDRLYWVLQDRDPDAAVAPVLFGESVPDDEPYQEAAESFLTWYEDMYDEPAGGESPTWRSDRMEYDFDVVARTSDEPGGMGETVLTAKEYVGGRLDWDDFSVGDGEPSIPPEERDAEPVSERLLPTAIAFPGMPAPRWWEFEDASVDLHRLDVGTVDLSRLAFSEFVLVAGDDWFITPIEVPIGSLTRIESVAVTDTFGERTPIKPTEAAGPGDWSIFRYETEGRDPGLFVPPVLADSVETEPVESVVFGRDEMANVAWAIERTVESWTGRPIDRFEATPKTPPEATSTPSVDATLVYDLATDVPDYWYPLVPESVDESIRLVRGGVLDPNELASDQPLGRILEPDEPLALQDEEVPRAGIEVTRSYQLARWIGGATHLWCGRYKRPGRGEATSGLRFDQAIERDE